MRVWIVLCFVLMGTLGRQGIDIPNPLIVSVDLWKCLQNNSVEFLTARAYRSYGQVDPNVLTNIHNAHTAGIKIVDVYIFPCVPCGNPRQQVRDTITHLKGETYGIVWLDVEEYAWTTNKTANQVFITEMLNELAKLVPKLGVYSNWYEWDKIVGRDWDGASKYLLWYPHWDHDPSFKDFRPFGGWKQPYRKQLTMDTRYCNEKFLLDYQPI